MLQVARRLALVVATTITCLVAVPGTGNAGEADGLRLRRHSGHLPDHLHKPVILTVQRCILPDLGQRTRPHGLL